MRMESGEYESSDLEPGDTIYRPGIFSLSTFFWVASIPCTHALYLHTHTSAHLRE